MDNGKLMIVDGNSILNRAFYAIQGRTLLSTSDGLYTNAVYGFLNILFKYLDEEKPEFLCVAFDLKAPTFRHKEYEGYKANRKGMPEELAVQVPVIKEVLDAMNIKRLEYEGYEADDIIGSVSLCAEERGMEVVIVTGDRDSLQLASRHTRIKIPVTRAGRTETDEYNFDTVVEKFGVTPLQLIDVKGLMGDQSDNIPGVPGIGEKTALSLIKEFGSIENLLDKLDGINKASVREKLEAYREQALLSKKLATIERNMPELCTMEELKIKPYDENRLFELFKRLEFKSFIEKLNLGKGDLNSKKELELKNFRRIESLEELAALKNDIALAGEFSVYYLIDKIENFTEKLIGIAITYNGGNSVYIDINSNIGESEFLTEFSGIFENPGIKKTGHDIKNFITYLKRKNIEFNGLSFDSMIAAYIIDPSRNSYTVSELSESYLNVSIESIEQLAGKGKNFTPFGSMPYERISVVAARHSEMIPRLKEVFDRIIRENGQEELYYKIELPLVEVLSDMEYWGFKVNIDGLREFSHELEEKINAVTEEIYDMAGEQFNINSPKQLGVILFEKLKLPASKKTKTGYSTNAEVLEQLSWQHDIVAKILEYRQLVKLKSTYVEGLINGVNPLTGRIHSSFNQTVTVTGRISSTEPNLQNIPVKLEMGRKIRKVFIPQNEDYVLCDADYSQIELRVLAHITGDENMIAAFKNNEDIHANTAARVFGIEKSEVTPLMRAKAKAVNFGIVYGIGEFSLSKDLGISIREAKRYIEEYLSKYPNVKQYMHDIVEHARKYGYVTTLFNRRRYLPELKSSNRNIRSFGERIAMNTPIQGSAADIIKIAMVNVYKELKDKKMKSRLILQVHDELIIETHIDEKEQVEEILKKNMENAACLKVPLSVEVRTGKSWYDTK